MKITKDWGIRTQELLFDLQIPNLHASSHYEFMRYRKRLLAITCNANILSFDYHRYKEKELPLRNLFLRFQQKFRPKYA